MQDLTRHYLNDFILNRCRDQAAALARLEREFARETLDLTGEAVTNVTEMGEEYLDALRG